MITDEQLAAIRTIENSVIVSAGAGSGKTTVIVERILHLLDRGVKDICVLTFSRAAAKELRSRVGEDGVQIGTYHSIILDEMRKHGQCPNVLSEDEADELFREAAMASGAMTMVKGKPKWKSSERKMRQLVANGSDCRTGQIFRSMLAKNGDIDYDTILRCGFELAKTGLWKPEAVIVDEAQDNDLIQWQIIHQLQSMKFVCGDVNQTIHQWRGARPDIFSDLLSVWKRYDLTETFRCPKEVVELSNKIKNITIRLRTKKEGGKAIFSDSMEDTVKRASQVFDPGEIAVLCRYNKEADAARESLSNLGFLASAPKEVERGPIFWLLRCLARPNSKTAMKRAGREMQPYALLTNDKVISAVIRQVNPLILENWKNKLGVHVGPAEALRAMEIPSHLQPEATKYIEEYENRTFDHFVRDSCDKIENYPSMDIFVGTMHSAKGLEWPCIVVVGAKGDNEEACRLLYVAMTRSMNTLAMIGDGWKSCMED